MRTPTGDAWSAVALHVPIRDGSTPFQEWAPSASPFLAEAPREPWRLFDRRIERYLAKYGELWAHAGAVASGAQFGRAISAAEKIGRESQVTRQFEDIKARLQRFPRSLEQRELWRESLLNAARDLAGRAMGLPETGLNVFFTRAGLEATRAFVQNARLFDSDISDDSLFQALRNLWVMQSIQLLLEKEVALTAPAFAYSMLYPWTDNYLDDPQIRCESKIKFCDWLQQRLCGPGMAPPDSHAEQVGRLIAFIEATFPRAEFEEVYLSLQAIHCAQADSLAQQKLDGSTDERELLQITMRKGGSSVLADAWLIAGNLSEAEADFMFGYGVLLQFMDDLQDVQDDLAQGHCTIFTRQGVYGPLDGLATRLSSFAQAVLGSSSRFAAQRFQSIKALIQENCKLLLLQSAAQNDEFFTSHFLTELETCSPCRFSFMKNRKTMLQNECQNIIALLRRQGHIHSVFDLLE